MIQLLDGHDHLWQKGEKNIQMVYAVNVKAKAESKNHRHLDGFLKGRTIGREVTINLSESLVFFSVYMYVCMTSSLENLSCLFNCYILSSFLLFIQISTIHWFLCIKQS